jgi:hypothetical protein
VFTGSHFFSDDGNLFAINGMYLKRSGSFLFVFDTNTGKLVYDVPSGGERACFSRSGDLLVVDGRGLQCWDLRQHRQLPEVSHENPFIVEDLIFAHQRDYLYYLSADYEGTPSESNPPKIMHLCCWSVPEKREVFLVRLGEANFPIPWYLRIDEHDRFLFAVSVSLFSDSSGHRDENVIYCLDANDGHLVRQFSKQGGESYDPVYPMDKDHIIVFRDSQLHPIRSAWQKLVGKEPQWLKSTFPNRSTLDLRDVETGRTVELLSLRPGHWPRFDNCFGAGLATRFEVNGTEEVALWSIEKRGRYFDALLLGAKVTFATWISLVILRRVWGRLKPNH